MFVDQSSEKWNSRRVQKTKPLKKIENKSETNDGNEAINRRNFRFEKRKQ